MGRARNHVDTNQFTISTTPQVAELLKMLVQMGFYGKNPAEAAERVLAAELNRLLREGALTLTNKSLSELRAANKVSLSRRPRRKSRGKAS